MADVSRTPALPDGATSRLAPGTYELTKRIEVNADGLYRFVDMPDGPGAEYVSGFWPVTRSQVRKLDPSRASDSHITDAMAPNAITERWVTSSPDEISHHSGDGHRYARWGQCVIPYDEEREPIPAVYSSGWGGGEIEFGSDTTWRLTLDETAAFIERLRVAVAYERAQGGESDV